jgi:hypothetical protein
MHPELQETVDLHEAIVAEAGNALIGYETEKTLANVVLLSEIPTTYDKDEKRQVNAGNLLLRGVPGVGKTFFGVILAAISNASRVLRGKPEMNSNSFLEFCQCVLTISILEIGLPEVVMRFSDIRRILNDLLELIKARTGSCRSDHLEPRMNDAPGDIFRVVLKYLGVQIVRLIRLSHCYQQVQSFQSESIVLRCDAKPFLIAGERFVKLCLIRIEVSDREMRLRR